MGNALFTLFFRREENLRMEILWKDFTPNLHLFMGILDYAFTTVFVHTVILKPALFASVKINAFDEDFTYSIQSLLKSKILHFGLLFFIPLFSAPRVLQQAGILANPNIASLISTGSPLPIKIVVVPILKIYFGAVTVTLTEPSFNGL